jgi:hypothetical protein
MGGKLCIRGMRVTVSRIVSQRAAGQSAESLFEDFPCLTCFSSGRILWYKVILKIASNLTTRAFRTEASMRRYFAIILAVVACFVMIGCGAKTDYSYMPAIQYSQENTMVYDSNINKVWDAAIKSIGEKFFVLDNIEKDSKIITLSYVIDNPENYIDCGKMTVETKGMSNSGTYTFAGAQALATYYVGGPDNPHPQIVKRTTRLEGKANIIFSEEGKDKTKVVINARYVLSSKIETQRFVPVGLSGYYMPVADSDIISFNTGQEGMGQNLRCVTKYTLEKAILDGIKEKL